MQPYTTDTSPEAEAVQIELIRRMSGADRIRLTLELTNRHIRECKDAIRRNNPDFSEQDVMLAFVELNYGKQLADNVRAFSKDRRNVSR
jgi:hypothetical protein